MPIPESSPLVNIEPLLPYLERGDIVLTVNARLARHIKAAWDHHQRGAGQERWARAEVYAVDHWLSMQWQATVRRGVCAPKMVLNNWQEQEIWRELIAAHHSDLLQLEHTVTLAMQARDILLRWQLSPAALHSLFELDGDCRQFFKWQQQFESQLKQSQQATSADTFAALAAQRTRIAADKRVVLYCVDSLAPLIEACLDALCSECVRVEPPHAVTPAFRCDYTDARAELAGVAQWAARQHAQYPQASIGIVLPDMSADRPVLEYFLRREFNCLGEDYASLPVNFSGGMALSQAPVVDMALRCLGLLHNSLPPADIVAVLQSRYVALDGADAPAIVALIEALYNSGKPEYDSADVRQLAPDTCIGELLLAQSLQRDLRQARAPSQWVNAWCAMLDDWGWPGEQTLDSLEYQQVQQFYSALEALALADELHGQLDYLSALSLLQRVLKTTVAPPQSPLAQVHVLGMLEAEGLVFDQLCVCRLQADTWPAPPRPNPFIPLTLQRQHNMPHATATREWDYATGLMRRYQQCSGTLYVTCARSENGVSAAASALVKEFTPISSLPEGDELSTTAAPVANWDYLDDWKAPAVNDAERKALRGGSGILQAQSQCPMTAFVRYRLGVAPLGEPLVGIDPLRQGNVLHSALYRIWGELGSSDALRKLDTPSQAMLIQRAVQAAISEQEKSGPRAVANYWYLIEQRRLEQVLSDWLSLERARDEFSVVQREQAVNLELEGLPIRLQIDRIDRLAGGGEMIIDYKSGQCSTRVWAGERPEQPQLPLYSLAADTPPVALSFASLHPQKMGFAGWGEASGIAGVAMPDEASWDVITEHWQRQLSELAREFMRGDAYIEDCEGNGLNPLFCAGEWI